MVEDLIQRARRRFVMNQALAQLAFAAAIAIAGLVTILLMGTRWLEWWTLSIFAVAGIVAGAWRVWRSTPGAYATAVRLDTNAGFSDTLSTALYFAKAQRALSGATTNGGNTRRQWRGRDPFCASSSKDQSDFQRSQRRQAEALAATVDLNLAVPFTIPRTLYLTAGFAVLASALLLVRLSGGHGLDLRPPITEVLFEDQAARPLAKQKGAMDAARLKSLEAAESLLAKLGIPLKPGEKQSEAALTKAIDEALDGAGAPGEKGKKGTGAGKAEDGKAASGLDQSPNGDPMDGKQGESPEQGAESKSPGGQQGKPDDKGSPKNGQNGDSSSLLSKLKDAISNMTSKASQDKNGAGQKGQQQGQQAKSDKASGEKGSAGKSQEQQGQQQGDAQAGDPNGEPQEGQQAEGKAGSKSTQNSSQAGSGVGSQDGAKDLKAAEQIKAMGKISEIIGKRAATVTGETTIEVQSGNQQLRTAYSSKTAAHGEADSDVSRDEIPVGLQSYVQQYFEQVRKSAPKTQPKTNRQ